MFFKYDILFQADVLHNYFDNGQARDIWFEPTLQCAGLLTDYRLNFKNTDNGFLLIAEQSSDDDITWAASTPIDIGKSFNFLLFSSTDLLSITDADLGNLSRGCKFFLGNNAATPTTVTPPATATATTKLSFDIWNGASLTTGFSIGPLNFVVTVNRQYSPFWMVLLDANDNVISKTFIKRNAENEITQDTVVLSAQSLAENIYTVQQTDAAGNVLFSESFFLTNSTAAAQCVGIFQIQYNAAVDAAVTAGNEIHFTAKLAARKVKWVYRVEVDQYDAPEASNNYDPAMLCLNTADNMVPDLGQFTPNILPGTPTVVTFESTANIDLKESPYMGVSLSNNINAPNLPDTIISNLPNPGLQWLKGSAPGNYKAEVSLKIK